MSEEYKDEAIPAPDSKRMSLPALEGKVYAGNPFTAFNTVLLLFLAAVVVFIEVNAGRYSLKHNYPLIFLLIPFVFLTGSKMFYFVIENGCLLVKNHYFPWIKRSFRLKNIKEVGIESSLRGPYSLQIISKMGRRKLYAAGSLRSENWKELLADLKSVGISLMPGKYTYEFLEDDSDL